MASYKQVANKQATDKRNSGRSGVLNGTFFCGERPVLKQRFLNGFDTEGMRKGLVFVRA